MANPEHLAILKQGAEEWNQWREKNRDIIPDLSGADLSEASLSGVDLIAAILIRVNLYKAVLKGANLSEADVSNANLMYANLSQANLSGTDLIKADLTMAEVCEANLKAANLSGAELFESNLYKANLHLADLALANFKGANLNETDLTRASLAGTVFADVDLGGVLGLGTLKHWGPSHISIGTIYRSKGRIPEVFLRGCGVPEGFITLARSLVTKEAEFYSCFISHSTKDARFCERLYTDLQAKGVRVWYFPEDAKWGESVWGEIDHSIKRYNKLVAVCSANSLQSVPVQREIERALSREDKEGSDILFPIRIDDFIFNQWEHERKADVVRKVVGDFSNWDKDGAKYQKALARLLEGLQAKSEEQARKPAGETGKSLA